MMYKIILYENIWSLQRTLFLSTEIKILSLSLTTRTIQPLKYRVSLIRHHCRHLKQYSAVRLRFRGVILSKKFCP